MNYQLWLDEKIKEITEKNIRPKLLLQCCCAPCSSYVFEYLCKYFDITAYYYNPNISPESEFVHRMNELKRLTLEMPLNQKIAVVAGEYEYEKFLELASGKEELSEGGARCYECYKLRLEKAAAFAKDGGFDFFSTTLSISPHKNAEWLNEIGKEMSEKYQIPYLFSDFKKRNGYKRSCELSAEYNLYRQAFCGCEFSRKQAEKEGRI